ncbi:Scarecrow-like protein 8 [Musa troglodytarum]|uniref:Scarecrow-like protein 8 n=1 Tax=Musa troglodytarum TaxID=320322 RepID=A0A9E7F133_9LILI|nr:Scarecrow-like protein 8 [Musa troglodytarum]
MASGFSARCGVQSPIPTHSDAVIGAILKRLLTARDRLQQQMQLQNMLFLQSVKHSTLLAFASSLTSSYLSASGFARRQEMFFFATQMATGSATGAGSMVTLGRGRQGGHGQHIRLGCDHRRVERRNAAAHVAGSDNKPSSAMHNRLQGAAATLGRG